MEDREQEEFLIMIARYQDGQLSEKELAAFDDALRNSEERRELFVELQKRSAGIAELERREAFAENDKAESVVAVRQWSRVWAVAAALVILIGIGARLLPQGDPVASVQRASEAGAFHTGDGLVTGQVVNLETGHIAVRFESGALLAVAAPAEFKIEGTNAASLRRGRATVRVPGKIKGFALDTPTERVIDLGTAFGVNVEGSGITEISVFEGEIKLSADQQLVAGQAVELARERSSPKEIPYREGVFAETWQISFGIAALAGKVRLATPSERPIPGQVHDSDSLLLFPERENVPLAEGYRVDATKPGRHRRPFRKREVRMDSDARVDSFLLQYNPVRSETSPRKRRFEGELQFDRPIVALVLQKDLLTLSDSILALPGVEFSNIFRRGINTDDEVTLSPDRRTLRIALDLADGVDQIRVLVASSDNNLK